MLRKPWLKIAILIIPALLVFAYVVGAQQNQSPQSQTQQTQPAQAQPPETSPPPTQPPQTAPPQTAPPQTPPPQAPPPQTQTPQAPPAQAPPPAKTPEEKAPAQGAQRQNPVKPTAESLAKGKKMYAIDCAMCHGEKGDGKGDMASDMKNVTDFTNPDVQRAHTDGEWFQIIRKGKGDMPPEGDRAKDSDIWSMVNYIREFAKK